LPIGPEHQPEFAAHKGAARRVCSRFVECVLVIDEAVSLRTSLCRRRFNSRDSRRLGGGSRRSRCRASGLEGDTFKICFAALDGADRPTDFATAGEPHVALVLERETK
jgi:hypothetical protein